MKEIFHRVSVRKFEDRPVEDDKLEQVLRAADPVVTNTPAQPKKHHRGAGRVVALLLSCAVISAACGFGGAILAQNGSSTGKTTVQQSNRTATTVNVKKVDGQKVQEVRIVYNFVGEIPEIAA